MGRETAIQKMMWTENGLLRMADGSNLAKIEVSESNLPQDPLSQIPDRDDFDGEGLGNWYYAPMALIKDTLASGNTLRNTLQRIKAGLEKECVGIHKISPA